MIEAFKRTLLGLLEGRDVSLAMIYDRSGQILWRHGRTTRGATVHDGEGFPLSAIRRSLAEGTAVNEEGAVVTSAGADLPRSARMLYVKSLLVVPIDPDLFLYVDSGSRDGFDDADRAVLRVVGELLGKTLAEARRPDAPGGGLSGTSAAIQGVRDLLVKYALEEEPVLLMGETGVGKNRAAELLHRVSGRRGSMVVVHLPSVPESLLESELFGHRRGAFTGASEDRRGLVEEAGSGTLLLDEVGEIPPSFQAKLLRFIETRRYRVVGDPREREADVRIVAATHRDLESAVEAKTFREDLYYRLGVLRLRIPPLRSRKEDVRVLVEQHGWRLRGKPLGEGFWDSMLRHEWPGNVRELVHVLARAGIEADPPLTGKAMAEIIGSGLRPAERSSGEILQRLAREIESGKSFWDTAWQSFLDRDLDRAALRELITERFLASERSLKRTAAALNISEGEYPRFVSALHRYAIHPNR